MRTPVVLVSAPLVNQHAACSMGPGTGRKTTAAKGKVECEEVGYGEGVLQRGGEGEVGLSKGRWGLRAESVNGGEVETTGHSGVRFASDHLPPVSCLAVKCLSGLQYRLCLCVLSKCAKSGNIRRV